MRGTIIRLIWARELRDLCRDRRWLFMLLGLPVLIYPAFGVVGLAFALATLGTKTPIGVVGADHLPSSPPSGAVVGPAPELSWLAATPAAGAAGTGDLATATAAFDLRRRHAADPPLLVDDRFVAEFAAPPGEVEMGSDLPVIRLDSPDRGPLDAKAVDALMIVPEDFRIRLARGENPEIEVLAREGDETSKLAARRLTNILNRYRRALRQARFARLGLPADFEQVFAVRDPHESKPVLERATDELRDVLVRFFPFMLVMWSLAGALYPAIDLCAGEKERGTMETLLISPAERGEIVGGKFLAVWTLAAVTAWWNLLWMGGGALAASALPGMVTLIRPSALVACAAVVLPLAALFSALCLALGVYARSTKEGQYYLLPIFLGTMPLVTLSLAPGIDLNLATSLIPVTGACLLLQKLMLPTTDATPWLYLPAVALSFAVCIGLALWWAVVQFHREDVLFRDAERPDLRARLRGWFRPRRQSSRG